MCACGRRRGTVGAAVRRHGGNARQEGRRINGKGGEARKERHGKERRHDGRPRQRTAEHWAAGQTTFCVFLFFTFVKSLYWREILTAQDKRVAKGSARKAPASQTRYH